MLEYQILGIHDTGAQMKQLAWSFLERIAARAGSAVLMISLAAAVDPGTVGLYSWMIIALTLTQAILDVPTQQVAVEALASSGGVAFLRRIQLGASIGGGVMLAATLVGIVMAFPEHDAAVFASLIPLLAVPACTAASIAATARLRRDGAWQRLATLRTWTTLGALAVTLPLILATGSPLGVALQPLIAEAVYAILVRRAARRSGAEALGTPIDGARVSSRQVLAAEWRAAVGYSFLAWTQGQTERVVIGAAAGPTTLGSFTFASALGRSGGDAVSLAGANVLRTRTAHVPDDDPRLLRRTIDSVATRLVLANTVIVLIVIVVATTVLPLILHDDWALALRIIPILAVASLTDSIVWCLSVALVALKRTRYALPIRMLGVALSIPIGLCALSSLELAAWLTIVREAMMLTCLVVVMGSARPLRSIAVCAASVLTTSAIVVALPLLTLH